MGEKTANIMLKILGNSVLNVVALANGRPGFVRPYNTASAIGLLPLIYGFSDNTTKGESRAIQLV
jgi:hypothetical protein